MKAHQALFEGGRGGGEPKNEALLFQSTVDIHFQNAHKTQKTAKASTLCVYLLWNMRSDRLFVARFGIGSLSAPHEIRYTVLAPEPSEDNHFFVFLGPDFNRAAL